jgi:uncharacterized delta-60 repeat protein
MRALHGFAGAAALLAAACFNPTYNDPICGPDDECPDGFSCDRSTNVCRADGSGGIDASTTDGPTDGPQTDGEPIDAAIDAPPNDGVIIDAPIDAPDIDAPIDAPDIDAPIDAPPWTPPLGIAVPLSSQGPDQLHSAAPGPSGSFYVAGFRAQSPTGTRTIVVARVSSSGSLITAFGTGGIVDTGITFAGGTGEVNVAVSSTGRVIVVGTTPAFANQNDRDIAVVALIGGSGNLDTTFGTAGVVFLDLGTGVDPGTGIFTSTDSSRAVAIGANDAIFVHAVSRREGGTDTDFTVAKLTVSGAIDSSFGGGDGKFTLDLQQTPATARGMMVLSDGSIIAGGYANTPGLGTTQPVLYKLNAGGSLVTSFGTGGVFHEIVLATQTEVYGVVPQGSNVVTLGYGRASGATNDWVSLRFNAATGVRDASFGGAPNGAVLLDPLGTMESDNGRNAIALPGNKVALLGSAGPTNMVAQEAAWAVLTSSGALDTTYGDGLHTLPFGSNGMDQFWGGAVSGTNAIFVGFKGAGTTQTTALNDDAYVMVLPLL